MEENTLTTNTTPAPSIKTVLIERYKYTAHATFSRIFVGGEFICFLMEDTLRPFGIKVYRETGIPSGVALLKLKKSPKYGIVPFIYNKKDENTYEAGGVEFRYIRIHAGNFINETLGCPLTATSIDVNLERTYNSRAALKKLIKSLEIGVEYELHIKNLSQIA